MHGWEESPTPSQLNDNLLTPAACLPCPASQRPLGLLGIISLLAHKGLIGGSGWDRGRGKNQKIAYFFCDLLGFIGPEGFQGVGGACGYVLTKFQPKRTHQTLVHTIFHDFCRFFMMFSIVITLYICARETQAVLELYLSV